MDMNDFFRKATLAMCSSLDCEVALFRSFKFLSQHIPVDTIYMNIYDPESQRIKYLAKADKTGGRKLDRSIYMTRNATAIIDKEIEQVVISNEPSDREIAALKRDTFGHHDSSLMTLLLKSEGQHLGAIDLVAKGWGRYITEHAEKLLQLREPFNIAMSNSLRHIELTKLKDMLADDNKYLSHELMLQAGGEIIGSNNGLRYVMELVSQVAPLNSTVLIGGETGVGKEIIANAIHNSSPRRDCPFIKINCGAIPVTH